jgi:hypothetical protein
MLFKGVELYCRWLHKDQAAFYLEVKAMIAVCHNTPALAAAAAAGCRYLVLDQGPMTGREADLAVTGGSIAVNISAARICSLTVQNTAGVVTLDHARCVVHTTSQHAAAL